MKGAPIREEMNGIAEPPGKTWFWELAADVVDAGRCVRCGTCIAVCPSDSLVVDPTTSLPALAKMCTGCSLCWTFCPRAGLNVEALTGGGPTATGPALFEARREAPLPGAQDGGVVTAVLAAALRSGAVDGVIALRPTHGSSRTISGEAALLTSPEEVERAAGSLYHQTMALDALGGALDALGGRLRGTTRAQPPAPLRLALVGTPCEVEGLQALQRCPWPGGTGSHLVQAVVLTVALFCTTNFDGTRLAAELEARCGVDVSRIGKIDITDGHLVVRSHEHAVLVDEPVTAFHGSALPGCRECGDMLGQSADLSVGSIGSPPGWSTVAVWTPSGRAAVDRALPSLEVRPLRDPDRLRRLDARNRRRARASRRLALDPAGPLLLGRSAERSGAETPSAPALPLRAALGPASR